MDGYWLTAPLDTYSHCVVGWAMYTQQDEALVEAILRMALTRRQLLRSTDLIHHSDRGSQYTADNDLALLP